MVNNMTTKMEVGSPMACAYLLNHPDHYTSHKFRPFYWRQYVRVSSVQDCLLRLTIYEHISLYDWVCFTKKTCVNAKKNPANDQQLEDIIVQDSNEVAEDANDIDHNPASFITPHPQRKTHKIQWLKEDVSFVPNFLGGVLPRRDQRNKSFYCQSMLVLFKPWRNAANLKAAQHSWEDAYTSHTFSKKDNKTKNHFQIRYECNDARDDFNASRKQGE
ncbi:hypothetical protein M422DRAFT_86308, partial [Sphaerobolus stellatus SS14]